MAFDVFDADIDMRLAMLAAGTTVQLIDEQMTQKLNPGGDEPLFTVATVGSLPHAGVPGTGMQATVLTLELLAWLQAEIAVAVRHLPPEQQARFWATVPTATEFVTNDEQGAPVGRV